MRVVYIGGYGRSGSTFLDLLLGQHSQIASGGEITNLPRLQLGNSGYCSCGEDFSQCPVWQKTLIAVLPEQQDKLHYWHQLVIAQGWKAQISRLFVRFWSVSVVKRAGRQVTNAVDFNQNYHKRLFKALAELQNVGIVVDSSKTTYRDLLRPLSLARALDDELYFVHLVRHPYAVMQSVKKGTNKALENKVAKPRYFSVLRGVVGWSVANLAALFNARFLRKGQHLIVKYEDLIAHPKQEIVRITRLLGLDPTDIFEFIDGNNAQSQAHLCEGNRMAKAPLILGGTSTIPEPSLKERSYYFIFCYWVELILYR